MSTASENLNKEYFGWLYRLVCPNGYFHGHSYVNLLHNLHAVDFTYSIDMDENRMEDGLDLRYRFGYEKNYSKTTIKEYLDLEPCSVLEMMIALAVRCEEHIMDDPVVGNRTPDWFWAMIENLGLGGMDDTKVIKDYYNNHFNEVIDKFLNREYDSDGKGGLFTVKDCIYDLREEEIWYQMCWYLNDILSH